MAADGIPDDAVVIRTHMTHQNALRRLRIEGGGFDPLAAPESHSGPPDAVVDCGAFGAALVTTLSRYSARMIVRVRGHCWKLIFKERLASGACGECDPIGQPGKQIVVSTLQTKVDLLDTIIHELLHAALPDLAEESTLETATAIAVVLHRLGATKGLETDDNPQSP